MCSRFNGFTGLSNLINYLHNTLYIVHESTQFFIRRQSLLYLFYDYILYNIFEVCRLLGFHQHFVMCYLLCTLFICNRSVITFTKLPYRWQFEIGVAAVQVNQIFIFSYNIILLIPPDPLHWE